MLFEKSSDGAVNLNESMIIYPNNLKPQAAFGAETKMLDSSKPEGRRDLARLAEKLIRSESNAAPGFRRKRASTLRKIQFHCTELRMQSSMWASNSGFASPKTDSSWWMLCKSLKTLELALRWSCTFILERGGAAFERAANVSSHGSSTTVTFSIVHRERS